MDRERDNQIRLMATAMVILAVALFGAMAFVGAMLLLDIENWKRFAAYFVLIPIANICFAIALGLGVYELTKGR